MAKKVLDLLKGMARKYKTHEKRESARTERREHKGKMGKVMEEYEKGELHSGSKRGPVVTNPKQAIAIGLSEKREAERR